MEKDAKSFSVRSKDGKVILGLLFKPGEGFEIEFAPGMPKDKPKREQSGNGDGSAMTHPQKRLLFRLLADKGVEGDKAHEYLKRLFQTSSLNDVSKMEASKMIEHLLKEAKGDAADDRAPF